MVAPPRRAAAAVPILGHYLERDITKRPASLLTYIHLQVSRCGVLGELDVCGTYMERA
jgi:hypothetical protein